MRFFIGCSASSLNWPSVVNNVRQMFAATLCETHDIKLISAGEITINRIQLEYFINPQGKLLKQTAFTAERRYKTQLQAL